MNYSTKEGQNWSFWCKGWSNHLDQEVFWRKKAFEAVEAIEVAEAGEVKEAAEVTEALKTITEDFRVIKVLEFSFILMF